MNIFGCVIFFFFFFGGGGGGLTAKLDYIYLCGSCSGLFKVKVLNWNYFLGYSKLSNIFWVSIYLSS